jgi:hypothetical protein
MKDKRPEEQPKPGEQNGNMGLAEGSLGPRLMAEGSLGPRLAEGSLGPRLAEGSLGPRIVGDDSPVGGGEAQV